MTEQDIQKKIIKYLESKGIYTRKIINANKAGTPDIFCCVDSKFFAFEVKTPQSKNNVSELQKHNIAEIIKSGGCAYVVWDLQQVKDIL